jgi:Protein phosphatase 2C
VWRQIAQSLQGPSHVARSSPCQDNHLLKLRGREQDQILIACVADGAGSSKYGGVGSEITCESIAQSADSFLDAGGQLGDLTRDDVLRWCDAARSRINEEATTRSCNTRELATTLCGAIVSPTGSCFFQIGDGAIVVRRNQVYGVVFWPHSGEYANTTNFLTTDRFAEQIEFNKTDGGFSDVALLTDGLERLALRFETRTPHAPFFDPFFRALRSTEDYTSLNSSLREFLGSASVRERSNDDKTLLLAAHVDDRFEDAV